MNKYIVELRDVSGSIKTITLEASSSESAAWLAKKTGLTVVLSTHLID